MTAPATTATQPQLDQLGVIQAEFPASVGYSIGLFITGIVLLITGVVLGYFNVTMFIDAFGNSYYSSDTRTGLIVLASFFALLVLFCLFIGYVMARPFFQPKTSVNQHENGLAIYRGKQLAAVVPWENITHVLQAVTNYRTYGVTTSTTYTYAITLADGRSFTFNNTLRRVSELGERLQRHTFPLILARSLAAFNAGQPVKFGALTLSQAGLSTKNASLPWAEVSGARVSNGQIQIQKQGRWLSWANLSVGMTPDALVLIALLNQLITNRTK